MIENVAMNLFCSYSTVDEPHRLAFEEALAGLRRSGAVKIWTFRKLLPGDHLDVGIDQALDEAHLIVMLVSSSFLNSDYVWNVEMKAAVKRHDAGVARLIPVVVRPCDWSDAPFGRLNALPTDAKAVTDWDNQDRAWLSVARGIRRVIEDMSAGKLPPRIVEVSLTPDRQWPDRGADGFLTSNGVLGVVLGRLGGQESVRANPFLLYENAFQKTWLVVTFSRMTCVLDDLTKGAHYDPFRWTEALDDVLPVSIESNSPNKGLIHLGRRHRDWLYSPRLHPDARLLQRTLEQTAQSD